MAAGAAGWLRVVDRPALRGEVVQVLRACHSAGLDRDAAGRELLLWGARGSATAAEYSAAGFAAGGVEK